MQLGEYEVCRAQEWGPLLTPELGNGILDGTGPLLGRVRCPVCPHPPELCRSRQRHSGQSTEVCVYPSVTQAHCNVSGWN